MILGLIFLNGARLNGVDSMGGDGQFLVWVHGNINDSNVKENYCVC